MQTAKDFIVPAALLQKGFDTLLSHLAKRYPHEIDIAISCGLHLADRKIPPARPASRHFFARPNMGYEDVDMLLRDASGILGRPTHEVRFDDGTAALAYDVRLLRVVLGLLP
jgi:hypothetical protein